MTELKLRELFKNYADAWEVNDEEVTMTEGVFIKLMYEIGTLQNTSSNSDSAVTPSASPKSCATCNSKGMDAYECYCCKQEGMCYYEAQDFA